MYPGRLCTGEKAAAHELCCTYQHFTEFNIEGTSINSGTWDLLLNMLGEFHFGSYTLNMKHKSNFSDVAINSLTWQQQRYLNLHLHTCVYINKLKTK
jgi:hypothetical protein